MLYDTRWENRKVALDALSLDGLIAWLEWQPADETYCYLSHGDCLNAKYLTAAGFKNVRVYSTGYFEHGSPQKKDRYPMVFDDIANVTGRTFGEALVRARTALSHGLV